MIKKIIRAKITSTITAETTVIGLKLVDAEGHFLKMFGTSLAVISAMILLICWAAHAKSEPATAHTLKHSRKNSRRSRAPRAN